ADLNAVRNNLSAYYKQIADIDLSGYNWIPIGDYDNPFTGYYDGNNCKITNLMIDKSDAGDEVSFIGLFGVVKNATFKNLTISNASIILPTNEDLYCYSIGCLIGSIRDVTQSVLIENCHIIKSNIAGTNDNTDAVAALIGEISQFREGAEQSRVTVKNCSTQQVQIKGSYYIGLLIGNILNDYYLTLIIEDCSCVGAIDGVWALGGLIGELYNRFGILLDVYISRCKTEIDIYTPASFSSGCIGGIIGDCDVGTQQLTIKECCTYGSIDAPDTYAVGGFIGYISAYGTTPALIENCYAKVDITSDPDVGWNIGGFIGVIYYRTSDEDLIVTNCYAAGVLPYILDDGGGGFVGNPSWAHLTVVNCYYNSTLSGYSDTGKGEPRTTEQMTYPYDDNTYIGWDFENVWAHDADGSLNDGYPILRWQLPQITWVDSELKEIPIMWQSIEFIAPVKEDAEILTAKYRIVTNDIGGYFDNLGFFINLSNEKVTRSEKVFLPIPRIRQGEIREFPVFGAVQEVQIVAAHIMFKETVTGNNSNYVQLQLVNKESDEIISTLTFLEDINAASYEVIS
ncbi:MAG TPA: GLUG motif-containing protein, partial [Tissierellaceae bacterium]